MATLEDNKLNPPLFIGTEFYHTVDELMRDFNPTNNTKKLPLEALKGYFEIGADNLKKKLPGRDEIKPLLENRIKVLEDNHRLETNNSLTGNRKRTIIEGLNTVIKTFNAPPEPSKTLINKNDLVYQLYKTLYGIVNMPEVVDGKIDVKQEFPEIAKYLESLTLDEALTKANELNAKKTEVVEKLKKTNALIKFVNSNDELLPKNIPQDKDSKNVSNNEKNNRDLWNLSKKAKQNIIKLFTLFRTQKIITDAALKKKDDEELTDILEDVLTQEDPTIARNIRLAYRSIIRFYRDQYLRVMKHMQEFFKKDFNLMKVSSPSAKVSYDIGPINPANIFPIDPMVRVVYIMNELERFVYKEGLSMQFNFFPTNEGLIRLQPDGRVREYNYIVELVKKYKAYTKTLGLKNEVDPATSKDDINYQLISMHTSPGPKKAILQLICGVDINYDRSVLETKIENLTDQLGTLNNYQTLREMFDTFFADKDTALYIIYQNAPIDLLKKKEVKIKQLDEIECLVTNVHSLQLNEDAEPIVEKPIPESAYNILQLLSRDKLKFKINNKFSEFGITIKDKPYQLVESITQLTGSLQVATYMDEATYYRKQK
jgi:hypothetical protein